MKMDPWNFARAGILSVALFLPAVLRADEQFGDISVNANAIYTGNTFHGYAEMRVVVENDSTSRSHEITLIYPNNSYNYGNSISRLARTVKLDAGTREVVSLLQPPLQSQGDGSIRVEVDGRHEGEVHAPNANCHCNSYSGRGQTPTVFISRDLDYNPVEHLFHANGGAFTAAMATGAPDARGPGMQRNCWVPDVRYYGQTNWLELDYATPEVINGIAIYNPRSSVTPDSVVLIGKSGGIIATIPGSSGTARRERYAWVTRLTFPATSQPVKTVHLDFGTTTPYNIAVDAVQISGPRPSISQWASDARASSDNSAAPGAYASPSPGLDDIESLRAESPLSDWSDNWLAYSPFDAVVLGAADMRTISPPVLAALGDYLYAGGNVVLLGGADLPGSWHPSQAKSLLNGTEYTVGFGNCFALTGNAAALDPETGQVLQTGVRDSARYWQTLPSDGGAANAAMPVVENLKVPSRAIIFIMLTFIIVIGPVNLIYLNRINRRTWMLWTIPAISLLTTVMVFAYSLLREGITPDTRIAGITLLDQTSHHAATIGGEAFYCPLTPSGGLEFDYGTEVTPLVQTGYGASGTQRELDWTQSQHLERGWVSARVPAHFHVRKTETRRERIQVLNVNDGLKVVNSLGAPIKTIWVEDKDFNVYQADNVDAGQMSGLIRSKQTGGVGSTGVTGLLHDIGFAAPTDNLGDNIGNYLQPGTYVAVLEGNPFLENGLGPASSPKRTKSSSVVFGILDSPGFP